VSATKNAGFRMETRPYGNGYANFVGITCGWCRTEAWQPARDGGWAARIFRANKWKVGSRPNQHRCPACFGRARLGRKASDNPAIPKEIGKVIKERIISAHAQEVSLTIIEQPQQEAQDGPPADGAPPIQADSQSPPAASAGPLPRRGVRAPPGYLMPRREHVTRSARTTLGKDAEDGREFYALPLAGKWIWKPAADVTDAEKERWTPPRKLAPRTPQKETPMTNITPIRKDPMPTIEPVQTASSPRQPTREERGLIHDELTRVYDNVDQRYTASHSDKTLAEHLKLPRAWVTEVRTMFFGDHDRNQTSQLQIAKLDAAIETAKAATAKLLQMASEAETLERELVAARKLLED